MPPRGQESRLCHTPASGAARLGLTRWLCAPLPGCWGALGEQGETEERLPLWLNLASKAGHPHPAPSLSPQACHQPVTETPGDPPAFISPDIRSNHKGLRITGGHSSFPLGPALPLPQTPTLCL